MVLKEIISILKRDEVILNQAKKNKEVVFGARALNKQVVGFFRRKTFDWDLLSKKPRKSARQLEKKLDSLSGRDLYFIKKAMHPGTVKVMHKGVDARKGTKDDFGVADYSKLKPGTKTVTIKGIRYVTIPDIVKNRLSILKKKEFAFRHRKDREDLKVIKADKALRKLKI